MRLIALLSLLCPLANRASCKLSCLALAYLRLLLHAPVEKHYTQDLSPSGSNREQHSQVCTRTGMVSTVPFPLSSPVLMPVTLVPAAANRTAIPATSVLPAAAISIIFSSPTV